MFGWATPPKASKQPLTAWMSASNPGETLAAQLVILGVGVRPETLATDAGLEIGPRGGIRVDEFMRTSDPGIHAVGDAVETIDFVLGERAQVPLAGQPTGSDCCRHLWT